MSFNSATSEEAEQKVASVIKQVIESGAANNEPFYVVDLEAVTEKYRQWRSLLPMVKPFYAVKCNPHPALLQTLAKLGTGFDCASKAEIDRILDMGIDTSRIIFANPCKMENHIMHAREVGVRRMTFDNADELRKVARLYPDAELVLRIITDDSKSLCKFSVKFGAPLRDVPALLKLASELHLNVIGVSFHVGSGCGSAECFALAARDAFTVFKWGEAAGFNMRLLDIGGGFQGDERELPLLSEVAEALVPELVVFKQRFPDVEFIAEPGRYFASKSHTLVCNVFARRVVRDGTGNPSRFVYYITDGVYQSFNCIFFDHQHPQPKVLRMAGATHLEEGATTYSSMIFGPTCDSLDCITKDAQLPELHVGDWLYFTHMGAYTSAAQSAFNGFTGAVACHFVWGSRFIESFYDVFIEPDLAEAREPDKTEEVAQQQSPRRATVAGLVEVVVGC